MLKSDKMKIAVHSGTFHADDCLAVYFLRNIKEFAGAELIRTREKEILDKCDVVCDVGNEYDHSRKRYDHHQQGFNVTYPGKKVTLSSCGLVFLNYQNEILENILEKNNRSAKGYESIVSDMIYDNFIKEIDAIDNGISPAEGQTPRYKISTDISSRIYRMNPKQGDNMKEFEEAVKLIGKEFENVLFRIVDCEVPAYEETKKAYDNRFDVDPSGHILLIDGPFFPTAVLKYIEKEEDELLFFVHTKEPGKWRIQVLDLPGTFTARCKLPFGGCFNEELTKASGIPGGIFCHKSGFLGVFEKKEQVIEFGRLAIKMNYKK